VLPFALPLTAHAGLLSLLSKAGKAGRVGSGAVKLSRAARLAKLGAGVTKVVVAERAAASLTRMGAEASHAGYLARTTSGELVMATSHGAPTAVDDVGRAVAGLADDGARRTLVLDPSVAATPEALAQLPTDIELMVADGVQQWPVRRVKQPGGSDSFLVEHGGDLVDLADYASQLVSEEDSDSDSDSNPFGSFFLIAGIGVVVLVGWKALTTKA
jgi:hypothetical protein